MCCPRMVLAKTPRNVWVLRGGENPGLVVRDDAASYPKFMAKVLQVGCWSVVMNTHYFISNSGCWVANLNGSGTDCKAQADRHKQPDVKVDKRWHTNGFTHHGKRCGTQIILNRLHSQLCCAFAQYSCEWMFL